ncbi:hypothetical protein BJ742DRAFT_469801 [Cladochytrium replicatum]|nr:hypothetical protein BJ742DRAFT_469801 [Cladochytrium replicatum]
MSSAKPYYSVLRCILREVNTQITKRNGNPVFRNAVLRLHRVPVSSPQEGQQRLKDAQDFLTYLKSSREHEELMQKYWPTTGLTSEEKLQRTVNRVGLTMPKLFVEEGESTEETKTIN